MLIRAGLLYLTGSEKLLGKCHHGVLFFLVPRVHCCQYQKFHLRVLGSDLPLACKRLEHVTDICTGADAAAV
jgi:hypothetical protein